MSKTRAPLKELRDHELNLGDKIRFHAVDANLNKARLLPLRMAGRTIIRHNGVEEVRCIFQFDITEEDDVKLEGLFHLFSSDGLTPVPIRQHIFVLGGCSGSFTSKKRLTRERQTQEGFADGRDYRFEYIDGDPTVAWYARCVRSIEHVVRNKWEYPYTELAAFCRKLHAAPRRLRLVNG
jgi:hypothetical protein